MLSAILRWKILRRIWLAGVCQKPVEVTDELRKPVEVPDELTYRTDVALCDLRGHMSQRISAAFRSPNVLFVPTVVCCVSAAAS